MALNLQFRGETVATFNASLSVETDDPLTPFKEVPITARVGTCTEGCPILHGTPDCSAGTCSVGTCNTGWYDTDKSAATGCECQEVGTDPGAFCSAAQDLGQLTDNDNIQRSYSGVIPTADDIDMIRFFGYDGNGFFSDDFNVKVRLQSSDPGIQMCVYRHRTGSHQTDFGIDYYEGIRRARNEQSPTNLIFEAAGVNLITRSAIPTSIWVYESTAGQAKNYSYGLYVNDKWSLDQHWNFQIGVRWDKYKAENESGARTAGAAHDDILGAMF